MLLGIAPSAERSGVVSTNPFAIHTVTGQMVCIDIPTCSWNPVGHLPQELTNFAFMVWSALNGLPNCVLLWYPGDLSAPFLNSLV
jgi:hypothetical protein